MTTYVGAPNFDLGPAIQDIVMVMLMMVDVSWMWLF